MNNTILVVDDEANIRDSIEGILKTTGYKVFTAESVMEGLKIVNEENIDLIISDIMMDPLDGYEFYEAVREKNLFPPIPFIFLSARNDREDVRKGMSLGADDYIVKPFSSKDVLDAIKARLQKNEKIKEKFKEISLSFRRNLPHELRTPLVGILGFSGILSEDNLDEETIKHFAKNINETAKQLGESIERIVAYAESLSVQLNPEILRNHRKAGTPVDLGLAIESNVSKAAENKRPLNLIDMEVTYRTFRIVEAFFDRIVYELASNAIKYSPKDSIIKVRGELKGGNYLFSIENEILPDVDLLQLKKRLRITHFKPDDLPATGLALGIPITKNLCEIMELNYDWEVVDNKIVRSLVEIPAML